MKYIKNEIGVLIVLPNGSKLYGMYKNVLDKSINEESRKEAAKILGMTLLRYEILDRKPMQMLFAMNKGRELIICIMETISREYANPDMIDSMFEAALNGEYMEMDEGDIFKFCTLAFALKDTMADYKKENPELFILKKPQYIYKIPMNEVMTLQECAEYFLYKAREFYIKTKPGVNLDDFYEEAQIDESQFEILYGDALNGD